MDNKPTSAQLEAESTQHLRSYAKSRKSGAGAWFWQRVTGLALVILTVGHYILMHYNPVSGHDYGETAGRLAQPAFKAVYLGFITIGMYHGLSGVWNVIRDFKLSQKMSMTLFGVIMIFGVIFVAWGWMTLLTFDPLKP